MRQIYIKYSCAAIEHRDFLFDIISTIWRIRPEACGTFLARGRGMLSVREKYWRYSLFILIAGLGIASFVEMTPFLGGLLGAYTIYVLLRRQMWFLCERRRWRRSLAASLLLGEAIFFFLIPISLIVWMIVD